MSDGGFEDHVMANGALPPQWGGRMEADDDSESSSGISSNASSDGNADGRGAAGPHGALEADAEGPRGQEFGDESADDQASSSDDESEQAGEAQQLSDASSSSDSEVWAPALSRFLKGFRMRSRKEGQKGHLLICTISKEIRLQSCKESRKRNLLFLIFPKEFRLHPHSCKRGAYSYTFSRWSVSMPTVQGRSSSCNCQ